MKLYCTPCTVLYLVHHALVVPVVALVGAAGVGGALGAAARHLRCGSGLRPRAGGWNGDSTIDTIHDIKQHITPPTINNDNEPPISFSLLYIINCTLSLTLSSYFQTGTTLLTSHCKILSVLLLHTRPPFRLLSGED